MRIVFWQCGNCNSKFSSSFLSNFHEKPKLHTMRKPSAVNAISKPEIAPSNVSLKENNYLQVLKLVCQIANMHLRMLNCISEMGSWNPKNKTNLRSALCCRRVWFKHHQMRFSILMDLRAMFCWSAKLRKSDANFEMSNAGNGSTKSF